MTLSNYDRWATREGPLFNPFDMCYTDWVMDGADETYAPFDETHCSNCNEMIALHLEADRYEPDRDLVVFGTFWVMDENYETLFCEDCAEDAIGEVE